jgi:hypothetical protein
MPVFDQGTTTVLANQDPGSDSTLPPSGRLDYHSMMSPSAVAPASGIDVKVVHGDFWQEIDMSGNMTENIAGKATTSITLSEQHTVKQNYFGDFKKDHVVVIGGTGNLTVSPGGSFVEQQFGPVNRFFVMAETETYQNDHDVHVPTSFFGDAKLFDNNWTAGTQINIVSGIEVELVNMHTEIGNIHQEFKTMHPEVKLLSAVSATVEADTKLTEAHTAALHGEMGFAPRLKAIVNALCSFGLGTPFR